MAYLGTEKLKKLIFEEKIFGDTPDSTKIKNGAYELSLGDEVFRTDSKDKKKEYLKQDKDQITINPGQFALLLTQESINVPLDKIAFISIKARIKLRGLVNVSGFHVDPGFKGNLVFSVYNAGTSPISLEKGEPCFLIWFAELTDKEEYSYNGEHKGQSSIPTKYIDSLLSGELASPSVLTKRIEEINNKIATLDWIWKFMLGVVITVAIKYLVDEKNLTGAVDYGYNKKSNEIIADSIYDKTQKEIKILNHKIDSLLNRIKPQPNLKHEKGE